MTDRNIAARLDIRVANYREPGPGGTIHVAAKAVGAPKAGLKTLCGTPVAWLVKMAPFEVGATRSVNPDGQAAPKDPLYGPRGCGGCLGLLII